MHILKTSQSAFASLGYLGGGGADGAKLPSLVGGSGADGASGYSANTSTGCW